MTTRHLPRYQNESSCEASHIKMHPLYRYIFIQIKNQFSYEKFCTKTRFQTEAQGTSAMAYRGYRSLLIFKRTSATRSPRMSDCKNSSLALQSHYWVLLLPCGLVGIVVGFGVVVGIGLVVGTLKENKKLREIHSLLIAISNKTDTRAVFN